MIAAGPTHAELAAAATYLQYTHRPKLRDVLRPTASQLDPNDCAACGILCLPNPNHLCHACEAERGAAIRARAAEIRQGRST